MTSKISQRWLVLFLLWILLFYCPWWLWLIIATVFVLKFSYYLELILITLWYDIVFGSAVGVGFWGGQYILTIWMTIIIWSVEQLKKILIFYR